MKKYSRTTVLPFSGFYGSWHDEELDRAFEGLFQTSSGDRRPELEGRALDHVDWSKAHTAYAKAYVENLAAEFKIKLLFDELVSPREYNFTTDRIFAFIPLSEVQRLRKETSENVLREVCKENLTSRSGFCSSYDPDPDYWGSLSTWDHNQIAQLLQAYIREQRDGKDMEQSDEVDLMEDDRSNGEIDNWVYMAGDDELRRLVSIAGYLRQREERQYRPLRHG